MGVKTDVHMTSNTFLLVSYPINMLIDCGEDCYNKRATHTYCVLHQQNGLGCVSVNHGQTDTRPQAGEKMDSVIESEV